MVFLFQLVDTTKKQVDAVNKKHWLSVEYIAYHIASFLYRLKPCWQGKLKQLSVKLSDNKEILSGQLKRGKLKLYIFLTGSISLFRVLYSTIVSQKHSSRCTCKLKGGMKADLCSHNLLYLIKCNVPIWARSPSPISTVPFPVLYTDFQHLPAVLVCICIVECSTFVKKKLQLTWYFLCRVVMNCFYQNCLQTVLLPQCSS